MNIFLLDWDHEQCARWHCDKHVVKMPLETTQMLSTVHWRYDEPGPYRPVHQKHPCTLWAGQTLTNYQWLLKLGLALCDEYTYRYGRVHGCQKVLQLLTNAPQQLTAQGFTPFAQAMPPEYKDHDPIAAYRRYYINDKAKLCVWKTRPTPPWMQQAMLSPSEREKSHL